MEIDEEINNLVIYLNDQKTEQEVMDLLGEIWSACSVCSDVLDKVIVDPHAPTGLIDQARNRVEAIANQLDHHVRRAKLTVILRDPEKATLKDAIHATLTLLHDQGLDADTIGDLYKAVTASQVGPQTQAEISPDLDENENEVVV